MTDEKIVSELTNFIWDIADLLRGPYRPPQYERVMLPLVVLRRFDCVLLDTKDAVVAKYKDLKAPGKEVPDRILDNISGQSFHNHSELTFEKLKGSPETIDQDLVLYIESFSRNVKDIFEKFKFQDEIVQMSESNILYVVISKFCDVDLHPNRVKNHHMGLIFENLIRRFNEAANETAGDHFTPREVVRLMVDILFALDEDMLTQPQKIIKVLDPACGTGGMLSEAEKHVTEMNADAQLFLYGQDYNPRSYAVAASDLLLKGNDRSEIKLGDTLIDDKFSGQKFDYLLANPPFGVNWRGQQSAVKREANRGGVDNRWVAGLPRVSDGSLLFLQHMISKFYQPTDAENGSRLAVVFNGSPLFTGGAGSGESDIRKWLIEEDMLEAIVALPEQMFYNTGISTYIWVVTNRKPEERKNKIQLIDARNRWLQMSKSLGNKRRYIPDKENNDEIDEIAEIVCEYGNFIDNDKTSKIFNRTEFGYSHVPIERPLRLLYQLTPERKDEFLNDKPDLLDDVKAIDQHLGRQEWYDWNTLESKIIEDVLEPRGSKWRKNDWKLFRDVFTDTMTEEEVAKVIADDKPSKRIINDPNRRIWGWFNDPRRKKPVMYESNTDLRDYESVPLQYAAGKSENLSDLVDEQAETDIVHYFNEEVEGFVPDAWADRSRIRGAYEINFNRYFYEYVPPRPLDKIDADIRRTRETILQLLSEIIE